LKNAAIAAKSAALPKISKELPDQFVSGPMTDEAVNTASMLFKKALIERALGADLGHHLGYEAFGYTIVLPANAVPGWPQDVPLPAYPAWKRDHAGSVRRLACDGADAQLASLFVRTVRPPAPDAEGADRARSATGDRVLDTILRVLVRRLGVLSMPSRPRD